MQRAPKLLRNCWPPCAINSRPQRSSRGLDSILPWGCLQITARPAAVHLQKKITITLTLCRTIISPEEEFVVKAVVARRSSCEGEKKKTAWRSLDPLPLFIFVAPRCSAASKSLSTSPWSRPHAGFALQTRQGRALFLWTRAMSTITSMIKASFVASLPRGSRCEMSQGPTPDLSYKPDREESCSQERELRSTCRKYSSLYSTPVFKSTRAPAVRCTGGTPNPMPNAMPVSFLCLNINLHAAYPVHAYSSWVLIAS